MLKDYLTCEKTWDQSEMKNMGDYHDHYLKKDVLLLVGVHEKFIDTCLKYYGLDPCHYFSSPGLSWDPMLKITDIKLEKTPDINKYLFIDLLIFTKQHIFVSDTKQKHSTIMKNEILEAKKSV